MEVDQPDRRERHSRLVEQCIRGGERRIELVHVHPAHEVDDRYLSPVGELMKEPAAPWRVRWVIERPQDRAIGLQILVDLALVPDVVAGGDDVDPHAQQLLCQGRRQSHAGRHVLAIGDHQVDVHLGAQIRQRVPDSHAARLSDDVSDEQAPHQVGAVGHLA